MLSNSLWKSHPLCVTYWSNLSHRVYKVSSGVIHRKWILPVSKAFIKSSTGGGRISIVIAPCSSRIEIRAILLSGFFILITLHSFWYTKMKCYDFQARCTELNKHIVCACMVKMGNMQCHKAKLQKKIFCYVMTWISPCVYLLLYADDIVFKTIATFHTLTWCYQDYFYCFLKQSGQGIFWNEIELGELNPLDSPYSAMRLNFGIH